MDAAKQKSLPGSEPDGVTLLQFLDGLSAEEREPPSFFVGEMGGAEKRNLLKQKYF